MDKRKIVYGKRFYTKEVARWWKEYIEKRRAG